MGFLAWQAADTKMDAKRWYSGIDVSHAECFWVCVIYLIPFAMGMFYSFMDSTADSHFVGLDNYRELFASHSFWKAASNTFYFSVVSVPLMLVLSLGLAILLSKNIYLRRWLRTAYVLPLVVPVASSIVIWQMMFDWNGSLNAWLDGFGIERMHWMKTDAARNVILVVYLWKNIGYNVILFLAGLQTAQEININDGSVDVLELNYQWRYQSSPANICSSTCCVVVDPG